MKKVLALVLALILTGALAACGGTPASSGAAAEGSSAQASAAAGSEGSAPAGDVTINFFGTFPDRTSGRGLMEQTNMDAFVAANPGVTIEGEFLADEAYKPKIQTYMASNDMPDIMFAWSAANFMEPMIQGNYIAELDPADFADFGFQAGALEAFTYDGKLYGIPSQVDFWVLYYNEKLLQDNGVEAPETMEDLMAAAATLNAAGVSPVAMAGKDKWPLMVAYHSLVEQHTGDPAVVDQALAGEISFAETPAFKDALADMQALIDQKVFQNGFLTADYDTAKNLFCQGQTAFFMMGSWEMGMGSDEQIDPAVRDNIRATNIPLVSGGAGSNTDLAMNYGAGYVVGANPDTQEQSAAFLQYMMQPDNYAKFCWENGVMIPVEKFDAYFTGSETNVQEDLSGIMNGATSASGSWICDKLTPAFKTDSEDLIHQYCSGMLTADEFLQKMDEAAAAANA